MQYKIYALALPFDLRCESGTYVIVISRYEYDIVVITRLRGEAEYECDII